jgi:hypothetical protein
VAVGGAEEREGAAAGCGDSRVGFFVGGHGWMNLILSARAYADGWRGWFTSACEG